MPSDTRRPPPPHPSAKPHPRPPPPEPIPRHPPYGTTPVCRHWRDYYPLTPLDADTVLPKPTSTVRLYSTKWKRDNPNPKSREGRQAFYGPMGMGMGGMGMGGMGYGGMMGGMGGMGMYPSMGGMGGYGYGMPRYGMGGMGGFMGPYSPAMYGGMGYSGMGGYGMYDPMMGYGMPPASNFVDDFPDAHRMEHAYRQSMPDSYGVGMGGMMSGLPGGMGINNIPGSQMMLYGRGMGGYGGGWYS